MNQLSLHFHTAALTNLELDEQLRPIYQKIERKKQKNVFGLKNWLGRQWQVVTHLYQKNVWSLVGIIGGCGILSVACFYYILGIYGNMITGDYEDPNNMGTWGHVPEWAFEILFSGGIMWKLLQYFQRNVKAEQINVIYRHYLASERFSPAELNRLNEWRQADLKLYESFIFLDQPFLPTESPLKAQKGLSPNLQEIVIHQA